MSVNTLSLTCTFQEVTVTDPVPDNGPWDLVPDNGPWKLVSVPADEIESNTSLWSQRESDVRVVRKYRDAYEVVIDPLHVQRLQVWGFPMDLLYEPTEPIQTQIHVYGKIEATRKARHQWLQHAADVIRSNDHVEVEPAYRSHALSLGLGEELARAILVHDIRTCLPSVQEMLAQNLVVLSLCFITDHESFDAHRYLMSDQETLLGYLASSLPITHPFGETNPDDAQKTVLGRLLLEYSSGRMERPLSAIDHNYSVNNADLFASLLGITKTQEFGCSDSKKMCNTLSKSPVFSREAIEAQDLEDWTTEMMLCLCIGSQTEYLGLPPQVSSGLGIHQLNMFGVYREMTSHTIPKFRKPENNRLLFLAWTTVLSDNQLKALSQWAGSEDGRNLYEQLIKEAQDSQNVEQFVLRMVALMNYRRLRPDFADHLDPIFNGSYLADLDTLFRGQSPGNSGRTVERMVCALVRVFKSLGDKFEDLVVFVETALNRVHPLLHCFDGFSDHYLQRRIEGQGHRSAMTALPSIKILEAEQLPEVEQDSDLDWDIVPRQSGSVFRKLRLQDYSRWPYVDSAMPAVDIKSSTQQLHGEGPLKINVVYTFGLSTTPRSTEPATMPSYTVAVVGSGSLSHGSDEQSYILIRLSNVEDGMAVDKLDDEHRNASEIASIERLGDGSWEICILESHRSILRDRLQEIFPRSHVDLDYKPLEPPADDLEDCEHDTVKRRHRLLFVQRATKLIRTGWPAAANCYTDLLINMFSD